MSAARRTVSIRLSLEEADKIRDQLARIGKEGQEALRKVDGLKTEQSERALRTIEARFDATARSAQALARVQAQLNKAVADNPSLQDRATRALAAATAAHERVVRAANDHARSLSLVAGANDNFGRSTTRTHQQMQVMNAAAVNTFQSLASGAPVMQTLVTQGAQLVGAFGGISVATLAVGGAVAVATGGLLALGRAAIEAGDAMTQAEGRLRAATGSMDAAREVYDQLYQISQRTGTAVAESAGQFVRFRIAGNAIGATNAEVVQLVETVQKFGIVSGASTSEAQAGAMQLAQALASGKLQGDELRSVLENMPLLAQEIAGQLGVPIGKLREMGEAGELSAERIFKAILDAKEKADEQFGQMPLTVERASNIMGAAWGRFTAEIDRSLGLSQKLAGVLQGTASLIDQLTGAIQVTALERYADVQKQLAELQRQINAGNNGVLGAANSIRDLGGDDQAGRAYAEQRLAQLRAQAKALHDTALAELRLRERREEQEQATQAAAKAEAAATAALEAYKGAIKGLHPEEEARLKRDEKRAAILAALDAGQIRNEDGTIDLARAQRDLAAVEREYQEALKKGEGPKGRRIAQLSDETDKVQDYINSLRRQTDHIGQDARERTINEAVAKAQNLAMEEGNLLTLDQIDLIKRLSAARYDDEQATRKAAEAQREAEQQLKRFNTDVARVAESIGQDISENLWDQITGEAKATDALTWFKNLFKRIAVEALNQKIVMPIVTQVVGSMPGLFGIQQPAMTTGGLPVGQPVTIGGQTYVPAGQPGGGTGLFGGGTGLGGIDSMAARWFPGTFAMPYDSLPSAMVAGIDDVGQLGYTTTANSTLPFSAGQALTAAGSLMSAVNAFQAFSQGRIGSGVGNVVSAGLGIASLAGVALGPLGPIGMIAAPIIGGLLDGLFKQKPSNREAGHIWDFGADSGRVESQTGKKAPDAAAQQASTAAALAIRDLGRRMEELSGGTLASSIFFGRGGRDPIRVQYNGREERFENSDDGAKQAAGWFAQRFAEELRPSFEEHVGRAVANIDFTDIEEGFRKLQFAMDFPDTVKAMANNLGLEDVARKQAKASMKEMTGSLQEFLKTTDELWPGTVTGATTRTETVREQTQISVAEAIAQGLLTRSTEYVGSETYETVWRDAEGRIVKVGEDLAQTVTVWREATKTVTEGGEAVASAESTQARAGVKALVDSMIAGDERDTYTEVEAAVAGVKAAWEESTVKPLLELAGYVATDIPAKIEEGLRNNLDRLREAYAEADERLMRQLDGRGAFNTIDDLVEARDVKLKDYAALGQGRGRADEILGAQLQALFEGLDVDQLRAVAEEYTGAIADAANAVRDVTLRDMDIQARTAIRQGFDPSHRMSVEDSLRLLDLPLTEPEGVRLDGSAFGSQDSFWLRRLRGLNASADAGTLDEAAALAVLDDLQAALDEGGVSLQQYQGLLGLLTGAVSRNTEAAAAAAQLTQQRLGLEGQVLQLEGNTAEIRRRELAAMDPSLRALQERIHALQDEQAAAAAAAQLTQQRLGLEGQILQLEGNAAEIRRRELAAMDPSLRALQERIYALQDEQAAAASTVAGEQAIARIRVENTQATIQSLQEQVQAAEQTRSRMEGLNRSLRRFRESLLIGNLSPLDPRARYEEARRQFLATAALAEGGNVEAIEELQQISQSFLEVSKAYNATNEAFGADFSLVQRALENTESLTARQMRTAEDQLAVLRQQLTTAQATLQALQQPRQQDLAGVLNGLTTSNLSDVVSWARRQGTETLQAVLAGADARLGWQNNPYRYAASAAVTGIPIPDADALALLRSLGYGGSALDSNANAFIAARGLGSAYENLLRQWAHDHGIPGYARGGVIPPGGLGLVGETGRPEIVAGPAFVFNPDLTDRLMRVANDRFSLPGLPALVSRPRSDDDMAELVSMVDRLGRSIEAMRADLRDHEVAAQDQRGSAAARAEAVLGAILAEVEELPRRTADRIAAAVA